jgi:hypothetical protein
MKKLFGNSALVCVLAIFLKPALYGSPAGDAGKNDVLIAAMQQELHRAQSDLGNSILLLTSLAIPSTIKIPRWWSEARAA